MTRTELEIKITEAIDGELSSLELQKLQEALQEHTDLREAFELLTISIPLEDAFPLVQPTEADLAAIREQMVPTFETVVIQVFPRFLLAAGILFLAMTTIFRFNVQPTENLSDDHILEWMHAESAELAYTDVSPILIPNEPLNGD